jgi:putative ABC transport system permease protein
MFGVLDALPLKPLVGSFATTRLLATMLYDLNPRDEITYAIVASGLVAIALLASYVPARRAMRVDPSIALREE